MKNFYDRTRKAARRAAAKTEWHRRHAAKKKEGREWEPGREDDHRSLRYIAFRLHYLTDPKNNTVQKAHAHWFRKMWGGPFCPTKKEVRDLLEKQKAGRLLAPLTYSLQ